MAKTVIVDATVVDPSARRAGERLDILVEDGRIADLRRSIPVTGADRVVQANGLVAAPAFIDLHTHLREPGGEGNETIETGTRAAAAGGFATIFCMPNTTPVCDSETGVQYVVSRAANVGAVNVHPVAAITREMKGEELTNLGKLRNAGARAFSDDGRPVMNSEIMRRALEYAKLLEAPIFDHCEDLNLTGDGVMHEGKVAFRLGLKGIPRASESIMVMRDVLLAELTGGHIHICHVSARESVDIIRDAKRRGVRVTGEASPHHLVFTHEDVGAYRTDMKMKPPLNGRRDRDALVAAVEDGTLDCIATDHAPHSPGSKHTVFDAAPFGIIGMETAFPVLYTHFVATGRWTLDFLVAKMTTGPAAVMNERWGTLAVGAPADIALLELGTDYVFGREHLRSKSSNCPWLGQRMKARIAGTLVGGKAAFESPDVFPNGLFGKRPAPEPGAPAKRRK